MALIELHGDPKRAIFLARYSRELKPDALTGQAIDTLTLGANTATDIWGDTVATIANEPCWVYVEGEDLMYLELDSDQDTLDYEWNYPYAQPFSFLVEMVEHVNGATTILTVSTSIPYVFLQHDGTDWGLTHHNGITFVQVKITMAKSAGDVFTLRGQKNTDGSIRLWVSKNGAAEVDSGASGALAPVDWGDNLLSLVQGAGSEVLFKRIAFSADPDATLDELQNLL